MRLTFCFSGSWFDEFELLPELLEFKLRSGEMVKRQLIKIYSSDIRYDETDKLRLVKIPYREGGFYMVVLIPRADSENIGKFSRALGLLQRVQNFSFENIQNDLLYRVLVFPQMKCSVGWSRRN